MEKVKKNKKVKKQVKTHLITVTMPNGSKFEFMGHEKIKPQVIMSSSEENHPAWSSVVQISKTSSPKVKKILDAMQF